MMPLARDGNGDVAAATTTELNDATRNAYTPYGAIRGTGTVEQNDHLAGTDHGWLNQVTDEASTGLIYLNARYYDPTLARFLSPDPVIKAQDPRTLDPYMYSANNPVSFSDKNGMCYTGAGARGYVGGVLEDHCTVVDYGATAGLTPSASAINAMLNAQRASKSVAAAAKSQWTRPSKYEGRFPYTHAGYSLGPEDFASDKAWGVYMWQDLRNQNSSWSHGNDETNIGVEARALEYGYTHGGHTYVGGPICGLYAVCVTGVSGISDHTAMTFGRIILADEIDAKISVWKQLHEYTHVLDYADVGAARFGRDYTRAWSTSWAHRGGDRPDDGNWLEKSANEHADAANAAWNDAGMSPRADGGPYLLPDAVKDVYLTTSYGASDAA